MASVHPNSDQRLKQLSRILANEAFSGPGRLGRFLKFVVEETIAGRSDLIKEYSIGTEVYDKPSTFDPKLDSTVRTEASKLRARLAAYYETAGTNDPLIIAIPKGTYVPTFTVQNVVEMPVPEKESPAPVPVLVPPRPARRDPRRYILIVAGFAAMAVLAVIVWKRTPSTPLIPSRITSDLFYNTAPALSPEGKLVVFASDRAGRGDLDIWIQPVAGGNPLRLTNDPTDETQPDISPDGSLVAYQKDREKGGIWIVPSLGGAARLIAAAGQRPRFSPDGTQITYFAGDMRLFYSSIPTGQIFVQSLTGGEARRVASEFAVAVEPIWISPSTLLFRGHPTPSDFWTTNADWYLADLASGKVTRTGVGARMAAQRVCGNIASFSPNTWTGAAVITAVDCDGLRDLWRVPLSGPATRLTFGNVGAFAPAAAGEAAIAYAGIERRTAVWGVALDPANGQPAGEQRRLTSNASMEYLPSLSSDGKWLAFTTRRSGNDDVVLRNLETDVETIVANGSNRETHALFSHDGKFIQYHEVVAKQNPAGSLVHMAWRRALTGGPPEKLCNECFYGAAPDGRRFLTIAGEKKLWIAQTDGAAKRPFLEHSSHDVVLAMTSPDRRWIAFHVRDQGDQLSVYVTQFRDPAPPEKDWVRIGPGASAVWSPDGRNLYYYSSRDGYRCLWMQPLSAGRPAGDGVAVAHFHSAARGFMPGPEVFKSISVARDRMAFTVSEDSGNIWLLRPDGR